MRAIGNWAGERAARLRRGVAGAMRVLAVGLMLSTGNAAAATGAAAGPHADGSERFVIALTGDSIITRKLSVYREPAFLRMVERIRAADVAFTNLEMLFHDYEPYPMAVSGGTWMRGDPELAQELAWAGFDLLSRANNHTGDYGVLGMELTSRYVEEAGLVHAGVGGSLAEAREAKFLETGKARVALVSVASTFAPHMRAGASRDDVPPRPGLAPLRYETTYVVTEEAFGSLRKTGEALGQFRDQDGGVRGLDPDHADRMELFGRDFRIGAAAAVKTVPHQGDLDAVVSVVRNADVLADFVIVSIHAHEGPSRSEPAEFVGAFARAVIDAGADVFVGHGPHALRGIEIHRGRPILYSLGDFVFQNETLLRLPHDNYARYALGGDAHVADFNDRRYDGDTKGFPANREIWEGVIALPVFEGGELVELELLPVDLGFGAPPAVRGRPVLAEGDLARKILGDLRDRSAPFGTVIDIRGAVGHVRLDDAAP